MTERKFYLGSWGPFYYDDADDIDDPDGDFTGESHTGLRCSGGIKIDQAPIEDDEVLRKGDLDAEISAISILTKLLTVDGAGSGLDADLLDGYSGAYYATAASVSANSTDITTLETAVDALEVEDTVLDGRLDTVEPKVGILEGEMDAVEADIVVAESDIDDLETWQATGVSGSYETADGKSVTVTNGIITSITDLGYNNFWGNH